ncbi:hypothetical protein Micbo1qcDRAFT_160328, partial [Microdochium bolleyi]
MSFVCRGHMDSIDHPGRSGGALIRTPRTKYDVPLGLTQEYLLAPFFFKQQHTSDILDSLQEHWHDWAGFGRTLYRYQDMFPWDC